MKTMRTLLYKEWLEHRSVSQIPLWIGVAGILLFVWAWLSPGSVSWSMNYSGADGGMVPVSFSGPQQIVLVLSGVLSLLLTTTYFPKTLGKERREGSLMFWRSMPVPVLTTHGARLIFGLLVIPLFCSALVLLGGLGVWIVDGMFNGYSFSGLIQVGVGWSLFLWRMLLVAVFLIPLACLTMLASQLLSSPLLILLLVAYAVKWLSPWLLHSRILSDFVSGIMDMPLQLLNGDNPLQLLGHFGVVYLLLYLLLGGLSLLASVQYYATGELVWNRLINGSR